MRLWTLHPCYLDAKGLVAVWREGLLAQKVLQDKTSGYQHHPQLLRFRQQPAPLVALASYLVVVAAEAQERGYNFDRTKISTAPLSPLIAETEGQLHYEWVHLLGKLQQRDPQRYQQGQTLLRPEPHPLFTIVPGPIRAWEKVKAVEHLAKEGKVL